MRLGDVGPCPNTDPEPAARGPPEGFVDSCLVLHQGPILAPRLFLCKPPVPSELSFACLHHPNTWDVCGASKAFGRLRSVFHRPGSTVEHPFGGLASPGATASEYGRAAGGECAGVGLVIECRG